MLDIRFGVGLTSTPFFFFSLSASERGEPRSHRVVRSGQRNQRRPVRAHSAATAATVPPCHRRTVAANACGRVRNASILAKLNLKTQQLSRDEVLTEAKDLYSRWDQLSADEKQKIVETIVDRIVVA